MGQRFIDPVGAQAIRVAQKLGMFESLPATADVLAEKLQLSPRGVRPLLYLLTSLELLREKDGNYSLASETPEFLTEEWPARSAELACPDDWQRLEDAVRTGSCVRRPIEGEADGGQFFSGVVETLFRLHSGLARFVGSQLSEPLERVLDLGAGSAVWSLGVLEHHPEAEAVAVDMPKVLDEVTSRFVAHKGMESRYQLRAGSYHSVELESEHYDLVYLGHVIHSEGWEASRSLLKRCRETLKSGGLLAVAEWVGR